MGKRKMRDYMDGVTDEDFECAQNLVLLKYSCDDSKSEEINDNPKRIIEKGECSVVDHQPSISYRLKDYTTKTEYVCVSSDPIEVILERFGQRDVAYGVKRVATGGAILTETDTKPNKARLSIARSKLDREFEERTFLTQTEANTIAVSRGRISVKVRGSFSENEYDMCFAKWFYASKRGFGYVWMNVWNQFRVDNGLQTNDPLITIHAIRPRHHGVLCFAIHGARPSS